MALILTGLIVCLVGYLTVTRRDVQSSAGAPAGSLSQNEYGLDLAG